MLIFVLYTPKKKYLNDLPISLMEWLFKMDVANDPVRVQRYTACHFKGLDQTFKMRYSTSLNFH